MNPLKPVTLVLYLLLSSSVPASEFVQWTTPAPGAQRPTLSTKQLDERYADEHLVHTLTSVYIKVGENSVSERIRKELFYRTAQAVQDSGDLTIGFDSRSERVVLHEAAVIGPRGAARHAREADSRVIDNDTYDVLTDSKTLLVQLPGLAPGRAAVLDYEYIVDRGALPSHWSINLLPKLSRPIQRLEFTVEWEGRQPRWSIDREDLTCIQSAGKIRCAADHVEALPIDPDVHFHDVVPIFQVGDDVGWNEVIARIDHGVQGALAQDDGIDALHRELTADATTPAQRIERLHDFAARGVRYVSLSDGAHSVVPHAVSDTASNRYGDCKDKSALLLSLLQREPGVEAWPVLVATSRSRPSQLRVPATNYFDHMVVCMRRDGSGGAGELCLDPTSSAASADHTPADIQGLVRLDLLPGARPSRLPRDTFRWELDASGVMTYKADSTLLEVLERRYRSGYASWMRGLLAGRTHPQRLEWLESQFAGTVGGEATPTFSYGGVNALDATMGVESTASFPIALDPGEPINVAEAAAWLASLTDSIRFDNEHYGYDFAGVRFSNRYDIKLEAWRPRRLVPTLDLKSDFGTFVRSVEQPHDNLMTVSYRLEMPAGRIALADKTRFNTFLEVVERESALTFKAEPIRP